ncbi:MAG: CRISPR-associated endonuclease Cas2 [Leptonema sp. (in: bacteria)]
MYNEVLVCYDISDNKRRQKLVKKLKDLGLMNIQESVFWGRILLAEERALKRIFDEVLSRDEDKIFFLKTDLSRQIRNNSFGYSNFEIFEDRNYVII